MKRRFVSLSIMKRKHWINQPQTFWQRLMFVFTGKPTQKLKSLIDLQREQNELDSKLLQKVAKDAKKMGLKTEGDVENIVDDIRDLEIAKKRLKEKRLSPKELRKAIGQSEKEFDRRDLGKDVRKSRSEIVSKGKRKK